MSIGDAVELSDPGVVSEPFLSAPNPWHTAFTVIREGPTSSARPLAEKDDTASPRRSALGARDRAFQRPPHVHARQLRAKIRRGVDIGQRVDTVDGVRGRLRQRPASGALPPSAFSTALARNAFASSPVTPTRTFWHLPLLSSVRHVATPTIAKPEAGWDA